MKVGVYIGSHPPETGGGHTFESELFTAFARLAGESRHEFVVLVGDEHAAAARDCVTATNVSVVGMARPSFFDRAQRMLQRELAFVRSKWRRKGRLQRVAESCGIDYMWFLCSDHHLLDMPYCAVVWDLQHRTLPWFPEVSHNGVWDARETSNTWFLRRAAAVITGTRTGADEISRFYQVQSGLIHVLPHPTPAYALGAAAQGTDALARYGITQPYLFYPAQFWAHKNHVNLLHALKQLRADGLPVQLVLSGSDQGNRAHCERVAAELGVSQAAHFTGFVPREDLIALYQHAAALAYVSFGGPENLPPLEAFALGCPVIAADIPGAHEQLEECAVYVDPAKPGDIAHACKRVIEDQALRERLIASGKSRATAWTGEDFVRGVFLILDDFEPVRRTWGRA